MRGLGSMVLVVYDVSDDGNRRRLAATLEAWGLYRIQRSAFVGRLQWARARDLAALAARIVDPGSDVVHLVPVRWEDWARALVVGTPRWGVVAGVEGARILA